MNANNQPAMRPEKSFKVGAVRAAIWPNTVTSRDGRSFEMRKVVLDRRYRNGDGEWKSTNSFDLNDVPKAVLALQKAYEYLMTKPEDPQEGRVEEEAVPDHG